MRVIRLKIENFRGIAKADLHFSGHTLLIGGNNVGKSTICEGLDLVLGPDRISKFPPVEEFDFYNGQYLAVDGETIVPARIEVVLIDLTSEVELACPTHMEFWHIGEKRLLGEGEANKANPPNVVRCLRLETIARYNRDEDEFEADTFFCHGTSNADESPERVHKRIKRLFGFLYLRALRTGSRALSLEHGTLLDLILRLQGIRTGLWERTIKRLRELTPPIADDAVDLAPVLDTIEKRLAQYVHLTASGKATHLYISKLTREHLRETVSFFLATCSDQKPVPFQQAGTGTLNTLVLALLSFIAEVKKDNVIFAMEEPEIALPPHTQRRIANYLLGATTQCFVSSHSPYVIEQFDPDQIQILHRDDKATVTGTAVSLGTTLKGKMYRRHARRGLAEAMLGRGVVVAEGLSERAAIRAVAEHMEASGGQYYPLDLSGVTIFPVEGEGSMPSFGAFFRTLGLKAYAFYDQKPHKPEDAKRFTDSFDIANETAYPGIERLLTSEIPMARQWQFLDVLRKLGQQGSLGIPAKRPKDDQVKTLTEAALKSNKGNEYAAHLIDLCDVAELPATITDFLKKIYADFPKPESVPIPSVTAPGATAAASAPASNPPAPFSGQK
jgi:putative ATP-dependent endonuclease of the OLD family